MIKYDPSLPFVEHFGMYQIPDTMADSVEQFRIDSLRLAMEAHGVTEAIFEPLTPDDVSESDNFGTLCDPIAYFGDTSLNCVKPGTSAFLPPVPSTLADLGVGGAAIWAVPPVSKILALADTATVKTLATLVAVSFCDTNFVAGDRATALRYIALNNLDHPASQQLRTSNLWQQHRRSITLPDMVKTRKVDFVKLFSDHGSPLESRELECLSQQEILDCATDMRYYILQRNRHVVFCKRCSNAMLYMNVQTMAPHPERIF